ncbi:MAG: hypothetical protein AB7V56_07005 [Candidatus Nitrosocosmicus sp.]
MDTTKIIVVAVAVRRMDHNRKYSIKEYDYPLTQIPLLTTTYIPFIVVV